MRILRSAIVLIAGIGVTTLAAPPADAARKHGRSAKAYKHAIDTRWKRQQRECANARSFDPTGQFAGFPCWAREAFGRAGRAPE